MLVLLQNHLTSWHVICFGECLEKDVVNRTNNALQGCDLLLVVDTSVVVYLVAGYAPMVKAHGDVVAKFNTKDTPISYNCRRQAIVDQQCVLPISSVEGELVNLVKMNNTLVVIGEIGSGKTGKNHGMILLPEGLIESIPEFYALLQVNQEINGLLKQDEDINVDNISFRLSPWAAALFDFLPIFIKKQLLLDRESDGSVQLSQFTVFTHLNGVTFSCTSGLLGNLGGGGA